MDETPRIARLAILPLLLGLLFFAASLTPSLIPRSWFVQGTLAGAVTAIGYMIGRFFLTLWRALELPEPKDRVAKTAQVVVAIPVLIVLGYCLFNAAGWQNSIRSHMGLEPIETANILKMTAVAVLVFAVCFGVGWLVQILFDTLRHRLYRIMPVRTANVAGLLLAVLIVFVVTRDGLVNFSINALDSSYAAAQHLFDAAPPAPNHTWKAGSQASLVDWGAMGQPGRDFVQSGPNAEVISSFTGRPAKEPLRIYVGRAQADDPKSRAQIALEEMKRVGAFDRKILIVASPTGTGWMDPGGMDPVEYIHDGDIAIVAVQYSYLQSPLALIFETDSGLEQATETMNAVYNHWKDLPPNARPRLYLHGISLGAWSSMSSFNIFQMVGDPVDGALWTGPPFPSRLWNSIMAARSPESAYVLPKVGSGDLVRFTSQFSGPGEGRREWGRMRLIYLQYASDPIVFYEPLSLFQEPIWMQEPPAPDVSPELVYVPVVTQFQLLVDMVLSTSPEAVPLGYGHHYIAAHYIEPWVAVTNPENWSSSDTERLKEWCSLPDKLGCRN
jgi:uncharacterized membrane protein